MFMLCVTCRLWEEGSTKQKQKAENIWQGAAAMAETIGKWRNYPSRLGSELHSVLDNPTEAPGRVDPEIFHFISFCQ